MRSLRRAVAYLAALSCTAVICAGPAQAHTVRSAPVWPSYGQAAYAFGAGVVRHDAQYVAPIASLAKVMTGYLVLRADPLAPDASGFRLTVTAADVADWQRRVSRDESTVPVAAGEHLSERQALAALLLPSANNIAIMLARAVSGSVSHFVRLMNRTARRLGMTATTYTDPSGFDAGTRSTAADQVTLARIAMQDPTFRALVARQSFRIPVAGSIRSTDRLLGTDGFVGIKTGSMDASGGCFMFLSHRLVAGRRVDLYGVVLGQPGADLIQAGLDGARRLVDRIAPVAA